MDYAVTKLVASLKVNYCCRGLQDRLLFCLCFLINVSVLPKKETRLSPMYFIFYNFQFVKKWQKPLLMSLNLKLVKFIIQIIFNIDQKKLILCIKQLIRHSFRGLGLLNKLKWIAQKKWMKYKWIISSIFLSQVQIRHLGCLVSQLKLIFSHFK